MGSAELKIGDLVWAKMKGHPQWPARIVEPISNIKAPKNKKAQFVCFFGSKNYAWILNENIIPHSESVFDTLIKKRNKTYQCAIDELKQELGSSSESMPVASSPEIKGKAESLKKMVKKAEHKNDFNGESSSKSCIDVDDNSVSSSHSIEPLIHSPKIKVENKKRKTKVVKILEHAKKRERKVAHKPLKRVNKDIDGKSPPSKKRAYKKKPIDSNINEETAPQKKKYKEKPVNKSNAKTSAASSKSENPDREDETSKDSNDLGYLTSSITDVVENFKPQNIGFIGLDEVGKVIVEKFLKSNFDVTLFNEEEETSKFVDLGAKLANSPAEIVVNCDITFCYLDSDIFKTILNSENGILKGFEEAKNSGLGPKGCVGLNTIEYETSVEINEAISIKNGLYLEAPICGTCEDISDITSIVLASGDRKLFCYCKEYFNAIAKKSVFMGCEIGQSSKMSMISNTLNSAIYVAMAEAAAFSQRLRIHHGDIDNILVHSVDQMERMINRNFAPFTPMKHMQKDMGFALTLADSVSQPLPVASAANEVYKHARLLNYSDSDVTAIYKIVRY